MHSKEPWSVANNGGIDQLIEDAYGRVVVFTIGHAGFRDDEKEANASRITDCINACGGVSTEDLQILVEGGDTFATVRDRHKGQIDALTDAALKAVPADGLVWVCLNAEGMPKAGIREHLESLSGVLTKAKVDGKTSAQFILTASMWPGQVQIHALPDEELERVGLIRTYVAKNERQLLLSALEDLLSDATERDPVKWHEAKRTGRAVIARAKGGSV